MAVAIASGLVAIVACDLWIASFRDWWDRHSLTGSIVSSLLVLGVTALIVDEILARRQRRERAHIGRRAGNDRLHAGRAGLRGADRHGH
jgi:hypothetical protein